ncbi:MAG: glutathione peroxidase [Lachnospiraceae bacterium]|nr:glutathione peroxidase [Lachnospiraceae bacterium]
MNVYDITVKDNKGSDVSLSKYKGKVLLIVNTATKCGLTPQYEGLEALYEKYHEQGFEILDFPCNQFAFQAPGSDEKIDSFCRLRYDTKFPRFAKIKVNGKDTDPLYVYLKEQKPGNIKWNFAKFLIDRKGNVVERFAPTDKPDSLTAAIEQELNKSEYFMPVTNHDHN